MKEACRLVNERKAERDHRVDASGDNSVEKKLIYHQRNYFFILLFDRVSLLSLPPTLIDDRF